MFNINLLDRLTIFNVFSFDNTSVFFDKNGSNIDSILSITMLVIEVFWVIRLSRAEPIKIYNN